jgi:hypothetical protein
MLSITSTIIMPDSASIPATRPSDSTLATE